MTSAQLVPAVMVSLLAWRVYSRVKRNIGRQRFEPKGMITRIVIFSVVTVLLGVASAFYHPASLLGLGGGLLAGLPLAMWAVHLTQFEAVGKEKFYTPNTHIGLAVTLLFVGRIAYRMVMLFLLQPTVGQRLPPQPALMQSPLTLVFFGVTAGYYIAFLTGVLLRMRKLSAEG